MHWLIACKDGETASVEAQDIIEAMELSGFLYKEIVAALASNY